MIHDQRRHIRASMLCPAMAAMLIIATPGMAATRGYTITSFDTVRLDAPITVALTTGAGPSARAQGDQAMLDRLSVDVSGRTLVISMARPVKGERSSGAVSLRLTTNMVSRIVLSGGGSLNIDRMKGLRGDLVLGGNGDVSVGTVDLDRLDVLMTGGGRVTLAGRAGDANIRVNGPGAVTADRLVTRQASIANDGPGSIAISADVTAKISTSGSGDVTISGRAACTVDNRGTGRTSCGGETY